MDHGGGLNADLRRIYMCGVFLNECLPYLISTQLLYLSYQPRVVPSLTLEPRSMTWDDFFGCDWDEYAQRISNYTMQRLHEQEIVTIRQQFSASFAIGCGIGGAAFTMGCSLASSVIRSRRYWVARKKHGLIQKEPMSRGVSLHEPKCKNFLIPVVTSVVGRGVGMGLDHIAMGVTNTFSLG